VPVRRDYFYGSFPHGITLMKRKHSPGAYVIQTNSANKLPAQPYVRVTDDYRLQAPDMIAGILQIRRMLKYTHPQVASAGSLPAMPRIQLNVRHFRQVKGISIPSYNFNVLLHRIGKFLF